MEQQKKSNPIDPSDIGSHNQNHLEGWKFGPEKYLTLKDFMETYKTYKGRTPHEIQNAHFYEYLRKMYNDDIENPNCSFEIQRGYEQDFILKKPPKFVMVQTLMQTIRINGDLYIIVSGTV